MIKSRRLAYDGRGNAVAKSEEELSSAVNGSMPIRSNSHKYLLCLLLKFLSKCKNKALGRRND